MDALRGDRGRSARRPRDPAVRALVAVRGGAGPRVPAARGAPATASFRGASPSTCGCSARRAWPCATRSRARTTTRWPGGRRPAVRGRARVAAPDRGAHGAGPGVTVEEAYERCREIARAEARNFYYGFVLLPPERAQRDLRGLRLQPPRRRQGQRRGIDGARGWRRWPRAARRWSACYRGRRPAGRRGAGGPGRHGPPLRHPARAPGRPARRRRDGPGGRAATPTSRRSRSTATAWRGRWAW